LGLSDPTQREHFLDKTFAIHIEGVTFPNWIGTDQKRLFLKKMGSERPEPARLVRRLVEPSHNIETRIEKEK
jgi:hypothetical protein